MISSNSHNKIYAFEFIINELLEWYKKEKKTETNNNDFSLLKVLKLLFFVSASKAKQNSPSHLLDNVFQSFVAMPYGHVESSIYQTIRDKSGDLNYFKISNQSTTIKERINLKDLNEKIDTTTISEILDSIAHLKEENPHLILMSPFELVDLSHAWYSWKYYYAIANKLGSKSTSIPPEVIKSEDKIFSLQMI